MGKDLYNLFGPSTSILSKDDFWGHLESHMAHTAVKGRVGDCYRASVKHLCNLLTLDDLKNEFQPH